MKLKKFVSVLLAAAIFATSFMCGAVSASADVYMNPVKIIGAYLQDSADGVPVGDMDFTIFVCNVPLRKMLERSEYLCFYIYYGVPEDNNTANSEYMFRLTINVGEDGSQRYLDEFFVNGKSAGLEYRGSLYNETTVAIRLPADCEYIKKLKKYEKAWVRFAALDEDFNQVATYMFDGEERTDATVEFSADSDLALGDASEEPEEPEKPAAPAAPKNIKAKKAASGKAKISWGKVSGADGYEVYMAAAKNGKYSRIKTISKASKTSLTKSKLKTGKTYYFKVRAYKTVDGKKVYSDFSKVKSVKV